MKKLCVVVIFALMLAAQSCHKAPAIVHCRGCDIILACNTAGSAATATPNSPDPPDTTSTLNWHARNGSNWSIDFDGNSPCR